MAIPYRGKAIRFRWRKTGKPGNPVEYVYFYERLPGSRIFRARCKKGVINSFINRVNGHVRRSRSGKTIYIEGRRADDLFRRSMILAGCSQCTRSETKLAEIVGVIARLGEFETLFWYSKMIKAYEEKGHRGVCRVVRAFKTLYEID